MNEKYLKVIESLGEIIISKDIDISVLKYEKEKLEKRLSVLEEELKYCKQGE